MLKNGEITDRFNTFVSPGRILSPEIIRLTGITDEMLVGAPPRRRPCGLSLDFAGDRPLAAHNADFDMGFIAAGCRKYGIPFHNPSIDSLILAQNLLPDLGKYKLDIVAEHLHLPAFNHHRASDDAATVGYMLPPCSLRCWRRWACATWGDQPGHGPPAAREKGQAPAQAPDRAGAEPDRSA